jgi:hypothetical protein
MSSKGFKISVWWVEIKRWWGIQTLLEVVAAEAGEVGITKSDGRVSIGRGFEYQGNEYQGNNLTAIMARLNRFKRFCLLINKKYSHDR